MTNTITNIVSIHLYAVDKKGKRRCIAAAQSPKVGAGYEESTFANHRDWIVGNLPEYRKAGFKDFEMEYSYVHTAVESVA